MVNLILTCTLTLQVLDRIQKSFIIELKIRIVWQQSTVSCLQVIEAALSLRDTYTHIPSEQLLTAEYSGSDHT